MPTLVMHSRHETRVPFEQGRRLAAGIPGARFVPLESRNHLILEDEPAFPRFLEEIKSFLKSDPSCAMKGEPVTSAAGRRRNATPNAVTRCSLLLLGADPADALDLERRPAALLGDLLVLRVDEGAGRFVALEPAEQLGRHAAVGALRSRPHRRRRKRQIRLWDWFRVFSACAAFGR